MYSVFFREFIEATKQDVTQLKIRETDSTSATAQVDMTLTL